MSLLTDRGFFRKALCATFLVSSAYTFSTVPGFQSLKGAVASPVTGVTTTAGIVVGAVKGAVGGAYNGVESGNLGKKFLGVVTGAIRGGVQGGVLGGATAHRDAVQEMSKSLEINVAPAPRP